MTLKIHLTDEDRAALLQLQEEPDTHRLVRDRASLLLLMDGGSGGPGMKLRSACQKLGRSYNWGSAVVHLWLGDGRGGDRGKGSGKGGPTSLQAIRRHPYAERALTPDQQARLRLVASMRRQGAVYSSIAKELGVTKERARQLVLEATAAGMDTTYGADAGPNLCRYTLRSAARELGVSPGYLANRCKELGIGSSARSTRYGCLTDSEIAALRVALADRYRCQVCGTTLPGPSGCRGGNGSRSACPEHRYEAMQLARQRLIGKPPDKGTRLRDRMPDRAWEVLKDVPPDPSRGLLGWRDTVNALPQLTYVQVWWLAKRGILASAPDPSGKVHRVTKQVVRLYYRNQVEALAKALANGREAG